jgi:hypothetical protein
LDFSVFFDALAYFFNRSSSASPIDQLSEALDQPSAAVPVLMVTRNPGIVMPVTGMLAVPVAFVVALRDDTP